MFDGKYWYGMWMLTLRIEEFLKGNFCNISSI